MRFGAPSPDRVAPPAAEDWRSNVSTPVQAQIRSRFSAPLAKNPTMGKSPRASWMIAVSLCGAANWFGPRAAQET